MNSLRLPLKTKWFEMTKAGIKTEDYREINEYWCKRLVDCDLKQGHFLKLIVLLRLDEFAFNTKSIMKFCNANFKTFKSNVMTLGYPKSADTSKILKLENKGIEIGFGKPEWGAEKGKVYFIIKHGRIL